MRSPCSRFLRQDHPTARVTFLDYTTATSVGSEQTRLSIQAPYTENNPRCLRMKSDLATFDLVIVVLYVLGTTLIGAWFTRRQRDLRVYFVGNRDVSWWLVLISIVATETSTVTFLSVP